MADRDAGVYLASRGLPSYRQRLRAALLYGGPGAHLADVTALRAYGVRYLPDEPSIYLLLPAAFRRANRDGVVVRRTHRMPEPCHVDGLPVCPPARAAVEFAARCGRQREATAVIAYAVQRRIVSSADIAAEAERVTGRGSAVVHRIAGEIVAGVRAAPESDFVAVCSRSRVLPRPLLNPLLLLSGGRKVSPDALFVEAGLVHECNGREPHADEDRFESMQARHDVMTTAGLTLLHNSPRQLQLDSTRIRYEAETCYRRLAGAGLPPGVVILRSGPPT